MAIQLVKSREIPQFDLDIEAEELEESNIQSYHIFKDDVIIGFTAVKRIRYSYYKLIVFYISKPDEDQLAFYALLDILKKEGIVELSARYPISNQKKAEFYQKFNFDQVLQSKHEVQVKLYFDSC